MTHEHQLGPRERRPGSLDSERLAAIKAAGRARLVRGSVVLTSTLATVSIVVVAAAFAGDTQQARGRLGATPTVGPLGDYQKALDSCLVDHGVVIVETTPAHLMRYPNPTDTAAPTFDDVRYQCEQQLKKDGYPVVPRSPEPGPPITQVLEIQFKDGTYTPQTQARVDACNQRPGVTQMPSAAPSPPSQRILWHGNNEDESRLIFGCLSSIPGVVVIDVPGTAKTS